MYRSGDYGRGSSGSRDRYERDRGSSRYRSPSPGYDRDRYRSSGGGSSSRYERSPPRRRSPSPPRYRSSGGSSSRYRSPSPGPSYGSRSGGRDSKGQDGKRDQSSDEKRVPTAEDNRNVLERMEKSFTDGPLDALKRSINEEIKVKVWTRNYKEVRGICTGYIVAFDKHWNIVMKDVDEVYLKPRKAKTPFLRDLKPGDSKTIPEMPPKVPKEKTSADRSEGTPMETDKTKDEVKAGSGADPSKEGEGSTEKPKKKRRKKKKTPLMCKRHIKKVFIRGDNVVMVALTSEDSKPEQSGEEDS